MAINQGKEFEKRMKADWEKTFGKNSITRIYDTTNGFKAISNICDFIATVYPFTFYLECKSTKSNTFSIPFKQYDKLLEKKDVKGAIAGIVIWFINNNKVVYVSIEEIERLLSLNYKSINCKKMVGQEGFNVFEIPSIKKVTYMTSQFEELYKYIEKEHKLKWQDQKIQV